MLKRIAVLGEIGSGNLGDDLGYVLLRDAISRAVGDEHIMLDFRPLTPNMFRFLPGYHWDAVMTGCGTLLDAASGPYVRALLAAAETAPIFIAGTGLADERHIAPTPQGIADLSRLLRIAKFAWLRATRSAATDYNGPDPFWLYGWRGQEESSRVDIGINDGPVAYGDMHSWRKHLKSLRHRHHSRLIAAWRDDVPCLQLLDASASHVNSCAEPVLIGGGAKSNEALDSLRSIVTTRVHLGALAACHGVLPVLPNYSLKVSEILQSGVSVPVKIIPHDCELEEIEAACFDAVDRDSLREAVDNAQATALVAVRMVANAILETLTR